MKPRNLREALGAAEDERVRQEVERARVAAESERQRQRDAPRLEAEKLERARISAERALEFVGIMKSHDIAPIGYYETTQVKVSEAGWDYHRDNSPMGYYEFPRFAESIQKPADVPMFLGWIAIESKTRHSYQDYETAEIIPGVFVSESSQTYDCSKLRKYGDIEYVTVGHYTSGKITGNRRSQLGEPDPTLLASDQALEKMVASLNERGLG